MASGLISVGGRTFQYEYKTNVSDSDVKTKAVELKKTWYWLDETTLNTIAKNMIVSENKKQASVRAYAGAGAIMKAFREAKLEIGISQRLGSEVNVTKIAEKYGLKETVYTKPKGTVQDANEIIHETITDPILLKASERTDGKAVPAEVYRQLPTRFIEHINRELDKEYSSDGNINKSAWIRDVRLAKPDTRKPAHEQFHDIAIQISGGGMADNTFGQEMHSLNRFKKTFVGPNRELQGFTFITRPHLNLSAENIARLQDFQHLLYAERNSIPYAVRMWMDPVLMHAYGDSPSRMSPFVDYYSPFFTPLCNQLISCNGWPDFNVGLETSEGGFFSENQTVAIGGDRLARGYDFSLSWKELQGGIIASIMNTWCLYMTYIGDGTLHQRVSAIEGNVMDYTVSIYRFLTDHTGRRITRYAKATGSFPRLAPTGTPFNLNQNEWVVTSGNEVSLQFHVHKVDYNKPIILSEFNTVVSRYLKVEPTISLDGRHIYRDGIFEIGDRLSNNFVGHPWITQRKGTTELVWLNYYEDSITGSGRTLAAT